MNRLDRMQLIVRSSARLILRQAQGQPAFEHNMLCHPQRRHLFCVSGQNHPNTNTRREDREAETPNE